MTLTYDYERKTLFADAPPELGTVGFISWRRMEEVLRAAGELQASESLKHLRVDQRGFTMVVGTKP